MIYLSISFFNTYTHMSFELDKLGTFSDFRKGHATGLAMALARKFLKTEKGLAPGPAPGPAFASRTCKQQ